MSDLDLVEQLDFYERSNLSIHWSFLPFLHI